MDTASTQSALQDRLPYSDRQLNIPARATSARNDAGLQPPGEASALTPTPPDGAKRYGATPAPMGEILIMATLMLRKPPSLWTCSSTAQSTRRLRSQSARRSTSGRRRSGFQITVYSLFDDIALPTGTVHAIEAIDAIGGNPLYTVSGMTGDLAEMGASTRGLLARPSSRATRRSSDRRRSWNRRHGRFHRGRGRVGDTARNDVFMGGLVSDQAVLRGRRHTAVYGTLIGGDDTMIVAWAGPPGGRCVLRDLPAR